MERKGTGKLRVINDQKVFDYFINEKRGTIVENELIYVEKGRPTHQYKLNPDYYHECMMYVKKMIVVLLFIV